MTILSFISDEKLYGHTQSLVLGYIESVEKSNLHSNVIDPFSAIFEGMINNKTYEAWCEGEKQRQVQKTLQNKIGDFHQYIIGDIPGWASLSTGGLIDVKNENAHIIGEIKNKFNTTKGDNKVTIYEKLEYAIANDYFGYTGYYVEVIPSRPRRYNEPFTPSDPKIHARKKRNEKIRIIDGYSFYALASGRKDALRELFAVLPKLISQVLEESGTSLDNNIDLEEFLALFNMCYGTGNTTLTE